MVIDSVIKDRRVVPKWRESSIALAIGELADSRKRSEYRSIAPSYFENLLDQWKCEKSITTAAELIASAHVYNRFDDVKEAVNFIIENKDRTTTSVLNLSDVSSSDLINNYTSKDVSNLILDVNSIYSQIAKFKSGLINDPRDSIKYVDMARLYSILGEKNKAKELINKALILNKNNRFIIRSAARFFTHAEEHDTALHYLNSSDQLKHDPWLLSAELSINTVIGKRSKLVKYAEKLAISTGYKDKHLSELQSSLATIYLKKGHLKKTKKLISSSLVEPTDNSLAQAIWANRTNNMIVVPNSLMCDGPPLSYEARSLNQYYSESWDNVLDNCINWLFDEPYSSRPAILASFISSVVHEDFELSKKITQLSLESNPNEIILINNLTVSLANLGQLDEADIQFSKIRKYINDEDSSVTLRATEGLLQFKKGNHLKGRELYLQAIEKANKLKAINEAQFAMLHLAREEIIANTISMGDILNKVNDVCKNSEYTSSKIMLNNVNKLYKKNKKLQLTKT